VGNAPADVSSLFAFFLFRHVCRKSVSALGKRPVPEPVDNSGKSGVS
jgi:hypothetical protein